MKGYEKKKTKRSGLEKNGCEFGDKEVEELHALLLKKSPKQEEKFSSHQGNPGK